MTEKFGRIVPPNKSFNFVEASRDLDDPHDSMFLTIFWFSPDFWLSCKESRIQVSKTLIYTSKAVKYHFHQSSKITQWKHQKQSVFLDSQQIFEKNLWRSLFFGKIPSWKSRTLLILVYNYCYKDFPQILSHRFQEQTWWLLDTSKGASTKKFCHT